jgi:hypothetical protein
MFAANNRQVPCESRREVIHIKKGRLQGLTYLISFQGRGLDLVPALGKVGRAVGAYSSSSAHQLISSLIYSDHIVDIATFSTQNPRSLLPCLTTS